MFVKYCQDIKRNVNQNDPITANINDCTLKAISIIIIRVYWQKRERRKNNEKTFSWRRSVPNSKQSFDFLCTSVDWFLNDKDLHHESVKCGYIEVEGLFKEIKKKKVSQDINIPTKVIKKRV